MTVIAINAELEAYKARIAEQDRIIAALQAQPARKLTCKVSEKGALSLYGMGRFPVTLYREQWERLFAAQDEIKAFIAANVALLSVKAPTT